jgi:hypothetical protein
MRAAASKPLMVRFAEDLRKGSFAYLAPLSIEKWDESHAH